MGTASAGRWITINYCFNPSGNMEGGKEALEDFAREAVALYGGDAPKLLLHRADIRRRIRRSRIGEDMARSRGHRFSDNTGDLRLARAVASTTAAMATTTISRLAPEQQAQPFATEEAATVLADYGTT